MGSLMQLVAYGAADIYLLGNNSGGSFDYIDDSDILLDNTNKWTDEYRLILDTDRNRDCPVTMEPINNGETYCICSQCKYNFSEIAITTIEKNKFNFDCPMCRTKWSDFTYYKNENFEAEILEAIREL